MSDVHPKVLAAVKQFHLFQMLDEEGCVRLARIALPRRFEAGEPVVREGDEGDEFFVIIKGNARVAVDDLGDEKEVARIGAGDFFGEMCISGGQIRQASIFALDELWALAFPGAALRVLLNDYPQLNEVLTGVGLKRSEENMERLFSGD